MAGWDLKLLVIFVSVLVVVRSQNETTTTTTAPTTTTPRPGSFGLHIANVINAFPSAMITACRNVKQATQDVIRALSRG